MKKIFYIASLACAMLLSGCDDFLTVESPDFSTDKFWRNKKDVEAGLSAVYGQLENRTSKYGFAEHKSPIEDFRGDDVDYGIGADQYPEFKDLVHFVNHNENATAKEFWMNCYNGINYANNVIYGIGKVQSEGEKLSDEDYNYLMGEAVFLRAYYHMELLMNWKDIIIREDYLTSESQVHKPVSPRIDAWEFVCAELDRASSLLPESRPAEEAGRVTKNAAYAYLGMAYLTRGYEESAQKDAYFSEAMSSFNQIKGAALEANYVSMFDGSNKNCKESIFEIQFADTESDGAYHKHYLQYWSTPTGWLDGWDILRMAPMLHDAYLSEGRIAENGRYDERAYASMIFDCPEYNVPNSIVFETTYDKIFPSPEGLEYCFKKYFPDSKDEHWRAISVNVPLMRYANVMLMKAEIMNEEGVNQNRSEAINLINQVRSVHGKLPAMQGSSYQAVKEQIEHERLVEFALEGYRFYDLRRWGKLEEAMRKAGRTNFTPDKAWLPIPLMEIQSNNAVNP